MLSTDVLNFVDSLVGEGGMVRWAHPASSGCCRLSHLANHIDPRSERYRIVDALNTLSRDPRVRPPTFQPIPVPLVSHAHHCLPIPYSSQVASPLFRDLCDGATKPHLEGYAAGISRYDQSFLDVDLMLFQLLGKGL